jgi:pimeloyl-ACP methyl ester carboxylesterase
MDPSFVISADGRRIAYDTTGEGAAILLLHGGGADHSRLSWHDAGYVKRLRGEFQVISIDFLGFGDSDKPAYPADYTIDKMGQDILSVADACGVERFVIWGFSLGGNIGRFLAARSDRVAKIIIMGIPMGPAASGEFRQFIVDFSAHWHPIVQAQRNGTLDVSTLSQGDQESWEEEDIPVLLGWLTAMLDWGSIEPADLRCPTLWLAGSENESTIASMGEYEASLEGSKVQLHVFNGLNHSQEFDEIEQVLPAMLTFTKL